MHRASGYGTVRGLDVRWLGAPLDGIAARESRWAGLSMDTHVFFAVLAAAAFHAGWNALLKVKLEPLTTVSLISAACGLVALPFALLVDMPELAAWPFIGMSLALHLVYYIALAEAYPELVCNLHRGICEGVVGTVGGGSVDDFATLYDHDPCRVTVAVGYPEGA